MTENGARVSEPRHVTETQNMSAGIQTDFHSNVTTKLTTKFLFFIFSDVFQLLLIFQEDPVSTMPEVRQP